MALNLIFFFLTNEIIQLALSPAVTGAGIADAIAIIWAELTDFFIRAIWNHIPSR